MSMNFKGEMPVVRCGPGRTKQSFQKICDVNSIVARYKKTGLLDHVRENPGVFADVSEIDDYHGMVSKIRFAQESFEQLPAVLRNRFDNDPGKLIAFVSDSENLDEAVKLGIIPKPVAASEPAAVPLKTVGGSIPPAKAEKAKPSSKAEPKAKD